MEPKDQQINIIYSDDNCYINKEGHLIRKENRLSAERKIAEVDPGDFETTLKEYQDAFSGLLKQAESEIADSATEEALDRLAEQLAKADVIGDFNALADLIDHARSNLGTPGTEATAGENDPDITSPTGVSADAVADKDSYHSDNAGSAGSDDSDGSDNAGADHSDGSDDVKDADDADDADDAELTAETDISGVGDPDQEVSVAEENPVATGDPESLAGATDQGGDEDPAGSDPDKESGDTVNDETATKDKATLPGQPDEEATDGPVSEEEQYYLDLVSKANDYARQTDWSHIPQLFASIYDSWNEGPELDASRRDALRNRVDKALETFNSRKSEHYDHLKEKRQKNLDYRIVLLERLQKIVDQKRWQAAGEVASIRRKWEDIRQLPSGAPLEEQNETFGKLLEVFDDKRVGYLVKVREKEEENLTGKLMILDKMEIIAKKAGPQVDNWDILDKEFDELTRQWRKIKHVPKEKEDEVWDRFKSVRDTYYSVKSEHDTSYKKELESNIKSKQRLIRKAVSLNEEKDLAKGVRTINRLHNEWKKIGPVPKELNDKLWDEFKAASDAFNKLKAENIDVIREQENQNYEQKVAICEKAEALADAENFKTAADEMVKLLAEWKKIGPVPRKKTNPVWNRFKKAMDEFYKKRRSFFKDARVEQKENLDKKREIIGKITALAEREDPSDAIEQVKSLQEEYKAIGFVPIKFKDSIWADYKSALDLVYGKARSSHRGSSEVQKHGGRAPAHDRADKKVQQEIFKLRRECDELRNTILNYNDTMTYIKPNKKGLELRQEIQNNIDEAEKIIREKQEKIEQLSSEV